MAIPERSGLEGDGRLAVAPPDQRLLQFVADAGEGQQRNRGAACVDDLQVLQGLQRTALGIFGTTDYLHQVDAVAQLGDIGATDHTVEDLRHLL
ncbi:hypothetical protein D9M70_610540 [compost metagenome]